MLSPDWSIPVTKAKVKLIAPILNITQTTSICSLFGIHLAVKVSGAHTFLRFLLISIPKFKTVLL